MVDSSNALSSRLKSCKENIQSSYLQCILERTPNKTVLIIEVPLFQRSIMYMYVY